MEIFYIIIEHILNMELLTLKLLCLTRYSTHKSH